MPHVFPTTLALLWGYSHLSYEPCRPGAPAPSSRVPEKRGLWQRFSASWSLVLTVPCPHRQAGFWISHLVLSTKLTRERRKALSYEALRAFIPEKLLVYKLLSSRRARFGGLTPLRVAKANPAHVPQPIKGPCVQVLPRAALLRGCRV